MGRKPMRISHLTRFPTDSAIDEVIRAQLDAAEEARAEAPHPAGHLPSRARAVDQRSSSCWVHCPAALLPPHITLMQVITRTVSCCLNSSPCVPHASPPCTHAGGQRTAAWDIESNLGHGGSLGHDAAYLTHATGLAHGSSACLKASSLSALQVLRVDHCVAVQRILSSNTR